MSTAAPPPPTLGWNMLAEILEQPGRVSAAFATAQEQAPSLAAVVRTAQQVLLFGRGSARSAATYAAEAFRTFTSIPAYSVSPAHFAWSGGARDLRGTVAVAVSQSGESTEILAAAHRVQERGGQLIVVTNSPDSSLARLVSRERTVMFQAGPEIAVPATKSFTTSLACLLAIATADDPATLREAATAIPDLMAQVLADPTARFDVSLALNLVCAGEGFAESVGEEGAIKFRETLRLPVASFETSEFLHGSINSVDVSTAVVVVSADGLGSHLSDQAVIGVGQRGARTVSVGAATSSDADQHVRLPAVPPHWMPFLAVLPFQLAAHHAAVLRGEDPDTPEGLTKVTRIQELTSP